MNQRIPENLLWLGTQGNTEKMFLTEEQWRKERRPEILELFRQHVYGRAPIDRPNSLRFEVIDHSSGWMNGKAVRKKVEIMFDGPGGTGVIHLYLFVPATSSQRVPAFLLICNRDKENMDPDREVQSPFWPAEDIISRGYAAAVFHVEDADPDFNDGFRNGVHGIFDPPQTPRSGDAWGTIAAWAWGASRVMDYLETDPDIAEDRIAVVGHSRGGKTALWCGAQDERFALVISNNSGCTGAAITRGKKGETVQDINQRFPHWFNENYKSYNGSEEVLPIDQHMLLALVAPRLLYVASATEDTWADPESEFLACIHADPIYRLLGLVGFEADGPPMPETPLQQGRIGYHLRTGKHDLTRYDWHCFMDFADAHM
ncbi:prolyl oligopeptidase family serine peptidase [Paenibacillus periandrae]|uniref:alpha/beta hydrolase family protein n=1 Tax=Paenibacillus periandrae TaxID=1761741 RepID=UPI001F0994D9|nr:prolyl oligopeptidase family serine peptidase [Paenibacillus periandrae]